jgi:hypothetical protein
MSRTTAILVVIAALVLGGLATLFVVQNAQRTTQLSLDLWVRAWELQGPVSVPALMGLCFGTGLLLGGGFFWLRAAAAWRRVRVLERQVALQDRGGGSGWS